MRIRTLAILLSFFLMWASIILSNFQLFLASAIVFSISTFFEAEKHYSIKYELTRTLTRVYKLFSLEVKRDKVKVKPVSGDRVLSLFSPLLKIRPISHLQSRLSASVEEDILHSGIAANPRLIGTKGSAYMLLATAVSVPISLYLSISISQSFFALLFAPLAVLIYPALQLKSAVSDRKKMIEDELPFFASYASVMQTIGRSLYYSITELAGEKIFRVIEREGLMVKRNVEVFAMDQLEALNNLALNHPSSSFKSFILGYVSIARSGGDITRYAELKSSEFFNAMRFRMSKYASHAGTLSESMLIVLLVLPALLISSAFVMPGNFVGTLTTASIFVVPIIAMLMILVTSYSQPKNRDSVEYSKIAIVSGVICFLIMFLAGSELWLALTVSVIVGGGVNTLQTQRQFMQISRIESALPDFMRDVTEYRKIGYDIPRAMLKISEERKYNSFFDAMVSEIASRVRFGYSFGEAAGSIRIRSWLGRLAFFVLTKVTETGGGTPAVLEYITNFISQFNEARREMLSSVRIHAIMAYSGPLMMVWIGQSSGAVLEKLGPGTEILFGSQVALSATPEFLSLVNLAIAVSALSMGMVVAKISYFTVKNTISILITAFVALLAIYLAPFLPTFV